MNMKEIKEETIRLYQSLPQEKEIRIQCTDVRDRVIELNYSFFGYIASHTFINNTSVTYEDKLQSALLHFCECWWWYLWQGDETHKGYRCDLSFTVFFKLRVGEMIERELNEVKYSIRRSLCMEVGKQLGKHWGQVKYDDLMDPRLNLPADKMNSLKAIFGTLYIADLDTHEPFLSSEEGSFSKFDEELTDKYDTVEELLIREMIDRERKLTNNDIFEICDIYGIDDRTIRGKLKTAETILYSRLKSSQDLREAF